MKKLLFIFIIIFLFAMSIQSQEIGRGVLINEDLLENYDDEHGTDSESAEKSKRIKNRGFELGLLNLDVGFGNNFLGLTDILQEKVIIDFKNFKSDFNLAFGMNVRPLFFNVNMKDRWGFGLDIAKISVYGNVDISGELLQINKTDGDEFGVGASAFAEVGIPAFFHVGKLLDKEFKINARLAGYVPLVYTEPGMKYTFKDKKDGSLVEIGYGMKVLSAVSFNPEDDMFSTLDIGKSLGFDFSVGAEYPLTHIIKIIDVDVGIDFINIPLFPAGLSHYMEMKDKISVDSSKLNIDELTNGGSLPDDFFHVPEDFEMKYGKGDRVNIFRPFKMLLSAKYRPLKSNPQLLTLFTAMGFGINPIFVDEASFELNLKAIFDINNLFISSFGMAYEDQMWKQGIDLTLNLRLIEWNFGIAMLSQDFFKSWTAAGLRVRLGGKIGW